MTLTIILKIALLIQALSSIEPPETMQLPDLFPGACFVPDNADIAREQDMTCIFATAGQYPPRQSRYLSWTNRCCFFGPLEDGVFWAIGESVMSPVTPVEYKNILNNQSLTSYNITFPFHLESAHLMDILALDATTDAVIPGARVTISDDAVHLVSYSKQTDEDGYAVIPVPDGTTFVMTIRADGYLSPQPILLHYTGEDNVEKVVELDPGIELKGRVVDPTGKPVEGAHIHAEVNRAGGGTWHSEIDLPRPISKLADGKGWNPYRGSYSTSENGRFKLETIPHGKIRLYASHERFAPSSWVTSDASDNDDLQPVEIALKPARHAWIRVEDAHGIAVSANISILDDETSYEIANVTTAASGALELKNLPEKARFVVTADAFLPQIAVRDIRDSDEITLILDEPRTDALIVTVVDENGAPIQNATLSLPPAQRKKSPACLGKTDSAGKVTLEQCPGTPWIDVYHPDFAHVMALMTPETAAKPFLLTRGTAFNIEMVDELTKMRLEDVRCTTQVTFGAEKNTQILTETHSAPDGILRLNHRPALPHHLKCTASNLDITAEFDPDNPPKMLAFPHQITRSAIVIDNFGSPVSYAVIYANEQASETDESGRATVTGIPDTKLDVRHWQHGRATARLTDSSADLELRLPDVPDADTVECVKSHHLPHIVDSAQILLDADNAKLGIVRGDAVESCSEKSLIIVRNARRMKVVF